MFLPVQGKIGVDEQRRHPLRTIPVKPVRQIHKTFDLDFVFGVDFFDAEHNVLFSK
jgi:hypothetical protein